MRDGFQWLIGFYISDSPYAVTLRSCNSAKAEWGNPVSGSESESGVAFPLKTDQIKNWLISNVTHRKISNRPNSWKIPLLWRGTPQEGGSSSFELTFALVELVEACAFGEVGGVGFFPAAEGFVNAG